VTDFVTAWIEECEPRRLGPAFTAAKSDLISLFAKLFKQVEVISETSSQKGMDPKFTLTPKSDAFNSHTLTVKFKYHQFPITYNFHLEPIPSPQEFVRDNVIKPLMFAALQMTKQLDEIKDSGKLKMSMNQVDPTTRQFKLASRNPYLPINGVGSVVLENYFRLQLDSSVFETAEIIQTSDSQVASSSQSTQESVKRERGHTEKETWKIDPIRVDSMNKLDLQYDSVVSPSLEAGSSDDPGMVSSMGTASSSGPQQTLPSAAAALMDEYDQRDQEMAAAAAIEERLAKKKKKREEQLANEVQKRPRRFV
jgi:hypothetical protein